MISITTAVPIIQRKLRFPWVGFANYEAEQKQLESEVIKFRQEIEVQERQNENVEKFIQKA